MKKNPFHKSIHNVHLCVCMRLAISEKIRKPFKNTIKIAMPLKFDGISSFFGITNFDDPLDE